MKSDIYGDFIWKTYGVEEAEVEVQQQKRPQLWGLYGNPNFTDPRKDLFIMKYSEQKSIWEYNLPEYKTRKLEKIWNNTDQWLEIGEFKNVLLTYQILCGRFDDVENVQDISVIMNDTEDEGSIINEDLEKALDELNNEINEMAFQCKEYQRLKEEGL